MGIDGAHKLSFSLGGLGTAQLYAALVQRKRHGGPRPIIDVDSSWIARRTSGKAIPASQSVVNLAEGFCLAGFDVCLITDSVGRHHSKRVSTMRHHANY